MIVLEKTLKFIAEKRILDIVIVPSAMECTVVKD
jgi:hypothetical protein